VAILLYWLSLPCSHQKMETSQESDFVFITQHTFSESFLEISTEIPLHHFLMPKTQEASIMRFESPIPGMFIT
jgi:hypothetical protein